MVRIRLRRMGAKKSPYYRIVVTDKRSPRDGRSPEGAGVSRAAATTHGHPALRIWIGKMIAAFVPRDPDDLEPYSDGAHHRTAIALRPLVPPWRALVL